MKKIMKKKWTGILNSSNYEFYFSLKFTMIIFVRAKSLNTCVQLYLHMMNISKKNLISSVRKNCHYFKESQISDTLNRMIRLNIFNEISNENDDRVKFSNKFGEIYLNHNEFLKLYSAKCLQIAEENSDEEIDIETMLKIHSILSLERFLQSELAIPDPGDPDQNECNENILMGCIIMMFYKKIIINILDIEGKEEW